MAHKDKNRGKYNNFGYETTEISIKSRVFRENFSFQLCLKQNKKISPTASLLCSWRYFRAFYFPVGFIKNGLFLFLVLKLSCVLCIDAQF